MIDEQRRRAYLGAMQVSSWVPRMALPLAAPSRPELLVVTAPANEPPGRPLPGVARGEAQALPVDGSARRNPAAEQLAVLRKAPVVPLRRAVEPPAPVLEAPAVAARREPPPRFTLQLLSAGACLLLTELPTGEPLASRDPAYRLLRDLLRAAGLADSPRVLGEPIRWPLIRNNPEFDQGPDAARDYVRTVLQRELEQQPAACIWLLGSPAVRFAGGEDGLAAGAEIDLHGLGSAWILPGLEQLMDSPPLKAELWQSMRRVRRRWTSES